MIHWTDTQNGGCRSVDGRFTIFPLAGGFYLEDHDHPPRDPASPFAHVVDFALTVKRLKRIAENLACLKKSAGET